jgi:hypothetical protein
MAVSRAPRRKMYKTMQGRMVDIEKLRGANEQVQAVGNMRVNARGDMLGQGGTIVKPKETVMKEYYETPKGRAQDTPRVKMPPQSKVVPQTQVVQPQKITPQVTQPKVINKPKSKPKSGIDAALDGIE